MLQIDISMRIGIHSGSVLCGILGLQNWQFDVWSNDVTIANRLESSGIPGYVGFMCWFLWLNVTKSFSIFRRIHISKATYENLKGLFDVEPGNANKHDTFLTDNDIETFFIVNNQYGLTKQNIDRASYFVSWSFNLWKESFFNLQPFLLQHIRTRKCKTFSD